MVVRLARRGREIHAAQALRYRVFYQELGAAASFKIKMLRRDVDRFDKACDHVLVLDRNRRKLVPSIYGQVVGTCRLMRRSVAEARGGFYTAAEFDLAPVLDQSFTSLELGRACVDPDYRRRAVIDRLWRGIAEYVALHRIDLMFGCASLAGTDLGRLSHCLAYLHHHHLAPASWRPRALATRYVDLNRLPIEALDVKAAWAELPPLLRGYLRLGAKVGEGAVIDHQFNTTDVCIVLPTKTVKHRYLRHYGADSLTAGTA